MASAEFNPCWEIRADGRAWVCSLKAPGFHSTRELADPISLHSMKQAENELKEEYMRFYAAECYPVIR